MQHIFIRFFYYGKPSNSDDTDVCLHVSAASENEPVPAQTTDQDQEEQTAERINDNGNEASNIISED